MRTATLGLIVVIAVLVLATPAVEAQQAGKVPTIGILWPLAAVPKNTLLDVFEQALRELGWRTNENIRLQQRYASRPDEFARLASELAALRVDVLVAWSPAGAVAAKRATSQIPVVFLAAGDPVGFGLVTSLAKPGGNTTGISFDATLETYGKGLQLLKEAVPSLTRIALIAASDSRTAMVRRTMQTTAKALDIELFEIEARTAAEVQPAVRKAIDRGAQGLYIWPSGLMFAAAKQVADLAVAHQLPSIHLFREAAIAGGLLSYAPSLTDIARRGAAYVDKILRGSKPGDLPVEQPTKLELIVNLKTARQLSLTIPPSLLVRADEVIQ